MMKLEHFFEPQGLIGQPNIIKIIKKLGTTADQTVQKVATSVIET